MNPFGMSPGELPDDLDDSPLDPAVVFKNFVPDVGRAERKFSRGESAKGREFVVEVRRTRRQPEIGRR